MKMKRLLSLLIAIVILLVSFSACSKDSGDNSTSKNSSIDVVSSLPKQNPLADKQYDALVVPENVDFEAFFTPIKNEYSSHIMEFSSYLTKHADEIENQNKGFLDFSDYEESLDGYYRFLYGIINSDGSNIPDDYQEAWQRYKYMAERNKADLDIIYLCKGQNLITSASNMLTTIQNNVARVNEVYPKTTAKQISIGDTIILDFVEFSLEESGIADKILPEDTNGVYSYIGDNENEQHFYITGILKNASGNTYDVENIYAQFVFDEKYTYSGRLSACDWGNDFYGENVKPLGTVKYYIHSSIPDELINTYSKCTVTFGFENEFANYYPDKNDCNYLFDVIIER